MINIGLKKCVQSVSAMNIKRRIGDNLPLAFVKIVYYFLNLALLCPFRLDFDRFELIWSRTKSMAYLLIFMVFTIGSPIIYYILYYVNYGNLEFSRLKYTILVNFWLLLFLITATNSFIVYVMTRNHTKLKTAFDRLKSVFCTIQILNGIHKDYNHIRIFLEHFQYSRCFN